MDALYTSNNLKGTKPNKMPRYSKIRGGQSAFRGISHHKVCIISAVDEYDDMIFEIIGLGVETKEKVNETIEYFEKASSTKYLITDMKQVYREVAEQTCRYHDEIKASEYKSKNGNTLATINQLHSEFKLLFKKYRGVSTRHLQGYLDFFLYYKKLIYSIEDRTSFKQEAYKNIASISTRLNTADISTKAFPVDLYNAYGDYHFGCFQL